MNPFHAILSQSSLLPALTLGLLAGCHRPAGTEHPVEATRAWIQREGFVPGTAAEEAPAPALQPPARTPITVATSDPFQPDAATRAALRNAAAPPAPPVPIRIVGTLVRPDAALALLDVGGQTLPLRVGDRLPQGAGQLIRVTPDSAELATPRGPRLLSLTTAARGRP